MRLDFMVQTGKQDAMAECETGVLIGQISPAAEKEEP
jgi:hypothetical protein